MLTAIHKETGAYIYGPDLSKTDAEAIKDLFLDPVFLKPCRFRSGSIHKNGKSLRNHFFCQHTLEYETWASAFLPDDDIFKEVERGAKRVSARESNEHLSAKVWLKHQYSSKFGYENEDIALEQRLKMPCGRWRIADLLVGKPNDCICIAVEAQISPISEEEIEKRTLDYESLGVDCHWWLGPKAQSKPVMDFLKENTPFFGLLDFSVASKANADEKHTAPWWDNG